MTTLATGRALSGGVALLLALAVAALASAEPAAPTEPASSAAVPGPPASGAAVPGSPASGAAVPGPPASTPRGPEPASPEQAAERVRLVGSRSVAVAVVNYDGYGLALPIRAGVELPLGQAGRLAHRLALTGEYAHFSRVPIPFLRRGVQLDAASLRAGWKLRPRWGFGPYAGAGAGLLVARDDRALGPTSRRADSTVTRAGPAFEIELGGALGPHVDIFTRYTQSFFIAGGQASFGYLELGLGARL
jgi:hypothetical protein